MIPTVLKRQFAGFGDRYGYDTTYLQEIVDLDLGGAVKLGLVSKFTDHRFGLPAQAYFAAKVTAAKWADCGSCLRLTIDMAAEAGVRRADLAAMLVGPAEEVPDDMALAAQYAQATIDNAPELAEILAACESRWGRRGVAGLAAATVAGLFYPLFKRGLGYGNVCEPVISELRAQVRGAEMADA
ncbi:MAG: hypothetical protein JJ913_07365 [Rhizobiaceae bacterium]|nr:hypothetical protein [Rhizobiaceae bacterium]